MPAPDPHPLDYDRRPPKPRPHAHDVPVLTTVYVVAGALALMVFGLAYFVYRALPGRLTP